MSGRRRRRSLAAAGAVMAGSVAASFLMRRHAARNRTRLDLYFDDGSMVSLPESTPQTVELLRLGADALELVRGGNGSQSPSRASDT